jgi:hypothetical protein
LAVTVVDTRKLATIIQKGVGDEWQTVGRNIIDVLCGGYLTGESPPASRGGRARA